MGLVDTSYQPWDAPRQGRLARIGSIVRVGLSLAFAGNLTKLVLIGAYSTVILMLGFLYVQASLPVPLPMALGNNLYHEYLNSRPYNLLLMVLTATVGARLISRDLQYNAISMYLSKGITRYDYLAGKLGIVGGFLLSATLAPSLLLWIGQIGMGQEELTWAQRFGDLLALTVHALVIVVPTSAAILALSSLSRTAFVPAISWVLLVFGSAQVSWVLYKNVKAEWCRLVSWQNLTAHLGRLAYESREVAFGKIKNPPAFRGSPELKYGWEEPAAILAAVTIASLAIVLWRLRKVEARE